MKYYIGIIALVIFFVFGLPLQQEVIATIQDSESVVEASSEVISSIDKLKAEDPSGIGIAFVSIGIVFVALLCLFLVFKVSGKVAFSLSKKRVMKMSGFSKEEAKSIASESGEVFAAIAMALEEISDEDHDAENMVLTMKNVARSYSPWSSKIYTLRELPRK